MLGIGCQKEISTSQPVQVVPEIPVATSSEPVVPQTSTSQASSTPSVVPSEQEPTVSIVLPLDGNIAGYGPIYKRFGEYFQDRFMGYHVGEDVEISGEDFGPGEVQEVPIRAIGNGTVRFLDWVPGYGGVVVIAHQIGEEKVNAIYGHIDLASTELNIGDAVTANQFLAHLGDHKTKETDGERQHLHFALYKGDDIRLQGYEKDLKNVANWINPQDFFRKQSITFEGLPRLYSTLMDPQGKKIFHIDFTMPADWDVEFIPSIQALNLYKVTGQGTARERSQMLIRYFDASSFLTLATVDILETKDLKIGFGGYQAKQYVIQKKFDVPNFKDQPSWRNVKHTVTDFRDKEGQTRYYVVAANPELDQKVYEDILASMMINQY